MYGQHIHGQDGRYITRIVEEICHRPREIKQYIEFICEDDGEIYRMQEIKKHRPSN